MKEISKGVYIEDPYVSREDDWAYVITFGGIYKRDEVRIRETEEDGAFVFFDIIGQDGVTEVMHNADECLYLKVHPLVAAPVYVN